MPGAARLGDKCTGHSCWPSRSNISASKNVFINNKGAHRVGDGWAGHCCNGVCHGGTLSSGSPNVYVNNRKLGRCGDSVSCGSSVMTCSKNVIVN
jgi:uncharacterized Zn-binding protein involved in type VI secretion